jgi:hypothetical protein
MRPKKMAVQPPPEAMRRSGEAIGARRRPQTGSTGASVPRCKSRTSPELKFRRRGT